MPTNIDRYKKDLDSLINKGELLYFAMMLESSPKEIENLVKKEHGNKTKELLKNLPNFKETYQTWYTESKVLIKQLLPDRLSDFVYYYEKPKSRKDLTNENYRIVDYLQGLSVTSPWESKKIVSPDAAILHFYQQVSILKSIKARFESSLFDIRQLVQADLFESELDAAKELTKHGFLRSAGALAGVVLERHLSEVCDKHGINIKKKSPNISDFNDALKEANVIDTPQWRSIQYLADIRNLCDHNKKPEPTTDQVNDLVIGVMKIIKTIF